MKLKDCKFSVRWSEEDEEWLATCEEFPSLFWRDRNPRSALSGLMSETLQTIKETQSRESRAE